MLTALTATRTTHLISTSDETRVKSAELVLSNSSALSEMNVRCACAIFFMILSRRDAARCAFFFFSVSSFSSALLTDTSMAALSVSESMRRRRATVRNSCNHSHTLRHLQTNADSSASHLDDPAEQRSLGFVRQLVFSVQFLQHLEQTERLLARNLSRALHEVHFARSVCVLALQRALLFLQSVPDQEQSLSQNVSIQEIAYRQ